MYCICIWTALLSPTAPLQHLAFSMAELVNMSPFSFTSDEAHDRCVCVGRKETVLFSLKLQTSRVREVNDVAWSACGILPLGISCTMTVTTVMSRTPPQEETIQRNIHRPHR